MKNEKTVREARTIIIGGGIAGMSCALELDEYNHDFIMITPNLGGRIRYDPVRQVNYGAIFCYGNYKNAFKILKKERLVNQINTIAQKTINSATYSLLSKEFVLSLPSLLRFYKESLVFAVHYEKMKKNWVKMSFEEAVKHDPYMLKMYETPAREYVREKRLDVVAMDFLDPIMYGCSEYSIDEISAYELVLTCQCIMLPVYTFSFDAEGMKNKLAHKLVMDSVIGIEKNGDAYDIITTSQQTFKATNVVVATEGLVAAKLLNIPETAFRSTRQCITYHVNGKPKKQYSGHGCGGFAAGHPYLGFLRNWDGTYVLFTLEDANVNDMFDEYEVIERIHWKTLMQNKGFQFVPEYTGENIYIVGEHHGCGMEPASISGIWAADRILKKFGCN